MSGTHWGKGWGVFTREPTGNWALAKSKGGGGCDLFWSPVKGSDW